MADSVSGSEGTRGGFMDDITGGEVRLSMPAVPELIRLARLTAAGLAARLAFSLDDVEDVKIAIDELCHLLVSAAGGKGTLTLTYRLVGDSLVVEGAAEADSGTEPRPNELSALILAAVADEHEVSHRDGSLHFSFIKART